MRGIISRFAPAPTGYLHLGHVVNAVHVWRETRAGGGTVLLRIEDHDRQRSRSEFEAAILDDLAWLGFAADAPPVRQSERDDIYLQALDTLRRRGLVYACACSRADVAAAEQVAQAVPPPLAGDTGGLRRGSPERASPAGDRAGRGRAPPSRAPRAGGRPAIDAGLPPRATSEICYPGTCRDRGLAD